MTKRIITVEKGYRKLRTSSKARKYPSIRLKGNWLEEAGFNYGKVVVSVSHGVLTITPMRDAKN